MSRIDWTEKPTTRRCYLCGHGGDWELFNLGGATLSHYECKDVLACRTRYDLARGRHESWRRSIFPSRRRRADLARDYYVWKLERETGVVA